MWPGDVALSVVLLLCALTKSAVGLGCYVCTSFNGSDHHCQDQFNTVSQRSFDFYNERCMGYRKERKGFFPADHCVKIKGVASSNPDYTIMIRTCSVDSGSMTSDTEIVRISHCGHFTYDDTYFSGCVQSCESDGCNGASAMSSLTSASLLLALSALLLRRLG